MGEPPLTPPPTLAGPPTPTVVPAKAGTQGRGSGAGPSPSPAVAHLPPIVVPAQAGTSPSATRTSAHPTPRRGGSRTARPARAGPPLHHHQPSPARPPPIPRTRKQHPLQTATQKQNRPRHPGKNRNPGAAPKPRATSIHQPSPTPNASFLRRQESRGAVSRVGSSALGGHDTAGNHRGKRGGVEISCSSQLQVHTRSVHPMSRRSSISHFCAISEAGLRPPT